MAKDLQSQYEKYNQAYFNGKLPAIPVRWSTKLQNDLWGCFMYYIDTNEAVRIDLAPGLKVDSRIVNWMLLHEMVHCKMRVVDRYSGEEEHPPKFSEEMRKLAAKGAFDDLW